MEVPLVVAAKAGQVRLRATAALSVTVSIRQGKGSFRSPESLGPSGAVTRVRVGPRW